MKGFPVMWTTNKDVINEEGIKNKEEQRAVKKFEDTLKKRGIVYKGSWGRQDRHSEGQDAVYRLRDGCHNDGSTKVEPVLSCLSIASTSPMCYPPFGIFTILASSSDILSV